MNAYQEHLDHQMGYATEHQNAFALAQLTRRPDDSARIRELVGQGRFCVVEIGPEYCPYTDGILGSRRILVGDFATREEAGRAAAANEVPPDIDCVVEPFAVVPIVPKVYTENEIPF